MEIESRESRALEAETRVAFGDVTLRPASSGKSLVFTVPAGRLLWEGGLCRLELEPGGGLVVWERARS